MKIVKFDNGKYGVRRFDWLFLGWSFKDFSSTGVSFWWPEREIFFQRGDCFTDLQTAKAFREGPKKTRVVEVIRP